MADVVYDKARESFLKGEISWSADTIKAVLVTSGYTLNAATHQYLSDISSSHRVVTSSPLTGKTTTAGVADADDAVFTLAKGSEGSALVLFKDTGVDSTSRLIAYIDSATGLPVLPNGADLVVAWADTANRIFKL